MFIDWPQVDPHCSYLASLEVSLPTAASRFLLVYGLQVRAPLRCMMQQSCFMNDVREVLKSSLEEVPITGSRFRHFC